MLSRRIGQHLKDQNWVAALVDFFIVVAGVFIGLQAANWNSDRIAGKMEKSYLMRLHQDLAASQDQLQSDVDYLETTFEAQKLVLSALKSCRIKNYDTESFNFGIASLGFINPPRLYRRTIDELIFSGRLDLLKSEEIKDRLAALIDEVEFRDQITQGVLRRTEEKRNYVEQFVIYEVASDGSLADLSVGYDIQEMCQDVGAARAISAVNYATAERMRAYEKILKSYGDMLPVIEAELDSRWALQVPSYSE